jgi:hypothetical protein
VTPRVIVLCGARNIIMIRLVAHSSHLAQPLDLCVFGYFKIFCHNENKVKERKGKLERFTGHYWGFTRARSVRWFGGVSSGLAFAWIPIISRALWLLCNPSSWPTWCAWTSVWRRLCISEPTGFTTTTANGATPATADSWTGTVCDQSSGVHWCDRREVSFVWPSTRWVVLW